MRLRDDARMQAEEVTNKDDESEGDVEFIESETDPSRKAKSQVQKNSPASRVYG